MFFSQRFWWLLLLSFTYTSAQLNKPNLNLIERTNDVKDFKKLLRTKTNVLVFFSRNAESHGPAKNILQLLAQVAERVYGKGTIAFVDCSDTEGKKLCKKFKVAPEPTELRHYHNGEFNKIYDRAMTADSMTRFLMDPKGDLPWEEDPTATDVLHLPDEKSLKRLIKRGQRKTLVMFYAPWCGHCKRLKPEYAKAATELKSSAIFAAMDVTRAETTAVQTEFDISGYPTLLYFQDGQLQFPFKGEHTQAGLVAFMNDPKPAASPAASESEETSWSDTAPEIVHLDEVSFAPFVGQTKSLLVMFYAPWCGHCKAMKPDYARAARTLAELQMTDARLAAVDATKAEKLAGEFKIQGFPTLKYFENGQFKFDFDKRSHDEIVEFMKNPVEPPPPPPPEAPWPEQETDVLHLNVDNFRNELKRKKHALVMFYAPWCGHCKAAKPHFTEAAAKFKDQPKVRA